MYMLNVYVINGRRCVGLQTVVDTFGKHFNSQLAHVDNIISCSHSTFIALAWREVVPHVRVHGVHGVVYMVSCTWCHVRVHGVWRHEYCSCGGGSKLFSSSLSLSPSLSLPLSLSPSLSLSLSLSLPLSLSPSLSLSLSLPLSLCADTVNTTHLMISH